MKNPEVKPDIIPSISAFYFIYFFFLNQGSIVEKMHLQVLFSVCYVNFKILVNFLLFLTSFSQVLRPTSINFLPFYPSISPLRCMVRSKCGYE